MLQIWFPSDLSCPRYVKQAPHNTQTQRTFFSSPHHRHLSSTIVAAAVDGNSEATTPLQINGGD